MTDDERKKEAVRQRLEAMMLKPQVEEFMQLLDEAAHLSDEERRGIVDEASKALGLDEEDTRRLDTFMGLRLDFP